MQTELETGGKREGNKLDGFVDWVLRNVFGRAESKITKAIFGWVQCHDQCIIRHVISA